MLEFQSGHTGVCPDVCPEKSRLRRECARRGGVPSGPILRYVPGPSIAASIQRRPAAPAATYTFGQAVRATCCSAAALLDSPRAIDAQPGMLLLDRLVLLLLLPPLAGAQAQGKQNQGGGLIGEVFGAGAPGDGGRNGMDHAWDGKTDTWFDCLGPPDNFWD
eukprot:COSAG06_NODE_20937_length_775_cov_5.690828_1_plen_161_part_01